MGYVEALILGLVQGATEFLPVSSSGHLTLAQKLLRVEMEDNVALDVALHAATLLAILVYFGRGWARRVAREPRLAALAVAAGVPAGALYLVAGDTVEAAKGNLWAVGALFAGGGAFLAFASLVSPRLRPGPDPDGEGVGPSVPRGRRGLAGVASVGVAQAAALFPGVSRSGSTIGAGLLAGLSREAAFEFSFLTATPLLFGAVVVKAPGIGRIAAGSAGALGAGAVVAFGSGLASLALLRRVVTRGRLWAFGLYTMAAGIVCFGLAAGGTS